MIKNERQYRITKSMAEKFGKAIKERDSVATGLRLAAFASIESQHKDLVDEITEYESLRSGATQTIEAPSIADLPGALIKSRIAKGMSQKDLATRLGVKEQQVQRYESTNYAGASLERIQEVVKALGIEVHNAVFLCQGDRGQ